MPQENTPDGVVVSDPSLAPDDNIIIPRQSMAEKGLTGLRTANGRILEEQQAAFRYPQFISTVREMRNNPSIGGPMNVWRMMLSRVAWDVEAPPGASDTAIARASRVRAMMTDMDHSWSNFIESVIPYLEYGFAVNEIVLRRSLRRNGSKYNDGVKGIKKLATRNPETIVAWRFDGDGELQYVEQSIQNTEFQSLYNDRKNPATGNIHLDANRLLVFSASSTKGNPEGTSIYKNIYLAHKQLTLLQEQELVGVAKDVQGILKIEVPPKYLDPNGSDSDKATASALQTIIDNHIAGKQRGLLVPALTDPETKQPLFRYDIMESKAAAKYDVEAIIKRLQSDIAQALCVDVLKLGADGSGSFSLAESKSSILSIAIDYRLREIREVLNQKLMRYIYEQNGWDMAEMAMFVYEEVEDIDLDVYSKAVQRVFSTSAIEVDRDVMNRIRSAMGVKELAADVPVDIDNLPISISGTVSSAGQGMAVGTTGNGTSTNPNGTEDTSTSNKENT